MEQFAQQFVTGISIGSIYAIIALAIVLIYRSTRTVNFAQGELATIAELIGMTAEAVPGLRHEAVADAEANVLGDARRREGRFGAYDIARMTSEFGWRPRPLRDAMRDYIAWLKENEA